LYRRILIALEGKETDQAILDHVQRLAAQTGAHLTLLRVIGIADDGGGGLGRQFQLEVGSSGWQRWNEAGAYLSHLKSRLWRAGLSVETALVVGTRSEGDEIVAFAAANGHDLIAMASDARSWVRRWIGGSPANQVLRKATVPTLFVGDGRPPEPVAQPEPSMNPMMAALGNADL
jgi:nucleotide-binding universal stress UspA family protein